MTGINNNDNSITYHAGFITPDGVNHGIERQYSDAKFIYQFTTNKYKVVDDIDGMLYLRTSLLFSTNIDVNLLELKCTDHELCVLINPLYCNRHSDDDDKFWRTYTYNSSSSSFCKCYSLCLGCEDATLDNCISCNSSIQYSLPVDNSKCRCLNHYFYNYGTNTCDICHEFCDDCHQATKYDCYHCSIIFGVNWYGNGKCDCATHGFYIDTLTTRCHKCHSLCDQCSDQYNSTCNSCVALEGVERRESNICDCSLKFYYSTEKQSCLKCFKLCDGCNSEDTCISCLLEEGVVSIGNDTCDCDLNYFLSPFNDELCRPCSNICELCNTAVESDYLEYILCGYCNIPIYKLKYISLIVCNCSTPLYFSDSIRACKIS